MGSLVGIEEYKTVLSGVNKEKDLKYRIKELQRYRKNGINDLKEAESYEAERIKRNKKKADRKKALESGLPEPLSAEPSPVKDPEANKSTDLDNLNRIIGLPGYEVLSHNEKRLSPKPVHPSGLDKVHRRKIFNFLLHSGWISA